jgi:hypothetical protein
MRILVLSACALTAIGTGCATSPVALEQANHTVQLTQALRVELERYQRNTEIAAQRRFKVIQQDEAFIAEVHKQGMLDEYFRAKAGLMQHTAAESLLLDSANQRAKLNDDQEQARQELANRLTKLLQDLPSPSAKLEAVQKAMAELGTELSLGERIKIITMFFAEAKEISDKSAKELERPGEKSEHASPLPPASEPSK